MALVPFPNKAVKPADDDVEPDWDDHPPDSDGGKMSFLEHLDELRRRIIVSIIAIAVAFVGAWVYVEDLFTFVFEPMVRMAGGPLQGTDPAELFMVRIKLAAMAGLIVAMPIVASQVWLFIAPGLYAHEKKWAVPFVLFATLCFVGGAAFSHLVVFPFTWSFFAGFGNEIAVYQPRVAPTFGIYLRLMLAFGVVFQTPVLALFLARMGVLTARFMIRNFKYALLCIFILSAVITPGGDWVTMLAMAGPLTLLYILSIGIAWIFAKKKKEPVEEAG
jgi:sec-independent protein translocase protein TatC